MNIEKLLRSSANPEKVGMTVKGALIGFVPLVIIVLSLLGVNLPEGSVTNLIEAITTLAVAGAGFVSAAMILFGLIRKLYIRVFKG